MPMLLMLAAALAAALWWPSAALAGLLLLAAAAAGGARAWPGWGAGAQAAGVRALSVLMLAWLLWLPASLAWSQSVGLALAHLAALLALPLAWLAGRALAAARPSAWAGLLAAGLPAVLALLVLWGAWQGPDTFTAKPQGPFVDPNTYAAALNLLLLPVLARFLQDGAAPHALAARLRLALIAGSAYVALLVASRGATLALLLVLPLLLWAARHQPGVRRRYALLAGTLLLAAAAAWATLHTTTQQALVGQRLLATVSEGDSARVLLVQAAWQMGQDAPLLGTGLGSFYLRYPAYRPPQDVHTAGGWVHNDYLQLWVEAGLPALAIILGLGLWLLWRLWQEIRHLHRVRGDAGALANVGWLAACLAVFIHALFNFLFYFALIALVLGLYLAQLSRNTPRRAEQGEVRLSSQAPTPPSPARHARALRLARAGYVLIVGWLVLGQVALDGLLGQAASIQRALLRVEVAYPRYEVAYWLSVLAPLHPAPQQVMALELADAWRFTRLPGALDEALARLDAAWQRAPCQMRHASEALHLLREVPPSAMRHAAGQRWVARALACNPRHGLSHFYDGLFALGAGDRATALARWRSGQAASFLVHEKLLLITAQLAHTLPAQRAELGALSLEIAAAAHELEANPLRRADPIYWHALQWRLIRLGGADYLRMAQAEWRE